MALKLCGENDAIGKHLSILYLGPSKSGKTKIFRVSALRGDLELGTVEWFAAWRQYNFFPYSFTTYAASCMRDLAEFCEWQTRLHKERPSVPKP